MFASVGHFSACVGLLNEASRFKKDGLVSVGIITETIAGIVGGELTGLDKKKDALPVEGATIGKDSRKAKAFEVFSQGKRPSDSEVKSLAIKPNTAYRYHQEWKKSTEHS